MKGFFVVIGWTLILSIALTWADAAPAEKEVPADTAVSDSKSESSSAGQAGPEQVPVLSVEDTRADPPPPASTGGSETSPVNKPTATVGTFFDSIFNIPTSVLRAVNQFLNNNIKIGQSQSSKTAASPPAATPAAASTPAVTSAPASNDVETEAPTPAGSATTAEQGAAPNKPAARSTFFDNIFNIPISAINSVNSLITGRKFRENEEKVPSNNNF